MSARLATEHAEVLVLFIGFKVFLPKLNWADHCLIRYSLIGY